MNRKDYLRRIGIERDELDPTAENLKFLQRQHLLNVPFENLDIQWKHRILLDTERFFRKIVEENRGGFCYELNGLFYELLREIGFRCKRISARVSSGEDFGAEYDHMAILTEIDDKEYLADVGFGDFTAEPLEFVLDVEQNDKNGTFSIRKYDKNYFEVVKKDTDDWKSEYIFSTMNRNLSEFAEMCLYQQTSPESHFTRSKVCSLMTENGRKTLTDAKFIETKNGEKRETEVHSDEEFDQILEREFNIKRSV